MEYKFSEIFKWKSGKPVLLVGGDIPVYGSNGIIGYTNNAKFSNKLIIGRVGAYCGSVEYCKGDFNATDNTLVAICDTKKIQYNYAYYLLKLMKLNNYAGGAAQPLVTQGVLNHLKCDIPSVTTQREVVEVLAGYDNLIANNNKCIKILEQMAENLYKEWFVRFRFPGYETAEFVDGVPKGWTIYRLDEICDINKYSLKKNDKFNKIMYLDTGSLTGNSISNLEEYSISDAPSRAKRKVKENSILFSTVRPALKHYGILRKVPKNMIVSTGFAVLDAKYDIANIVFLYLSSEVVLNYCQMIAEGAVATYPTIKPEEIGKVKILLPPIETAVDWNGKLEDYFSMKQKLIEQNQNLIKQRDYLLPRLMSGKLQVK